MSHPETVRIVSDNPAHAGGFVVINAADFDPQKHVLFEDDKPAAKAQAKKTKEPAV